MASRAPARRRAPAAPPAPPPAPAAPVRLPSWVPVVGSDFRTIEEIVALAGTRYRGWAVNEHGKFAVDMMDGELCQRFTGATLAEALEKALELAMRLPPA